MRGADFLDMTETDFDEVINVNLKGVFLVLSSIAPCTLLHAIEGCICAHAAVHACVLEDMIQA